MEGKQTGAINTLTLNDATYDNEIINPNTVNFFYGNNGSGKSTIGRTIAARTGLELKAEAILN